MNCHVNSKKIPNKLFPGEIKMEKLFSLETTIYRFVTFYMPNYNNNKVEIALKRHVTLFYKFPREIEICLFVRIIHTASTPMSKAYIIKLNFYWFRLRLRCVYTELSYNSLDYISNVYNI